MYCGCILGRALAASLLRARFFSSLAWVSPVFSHLKWFVRIQKLPEWLGRPMTWVWFALWRHNRCTQNIHIPAALGAYCFVCARQLSPIEVAWPTWAITLNDGQLLSVVATNKEHAMNLVVFGESATRGQVDRLAMTTGRYRIHPQNILRCERQTHGGQPLAPGR